MDLVPDQLVDVVPERGLLVAVELGGGVVEELVDLGSADPGVVLLHVL